MSTWKRLLYGESTMDAVLQDVHRGLSIKRAAEQNEHLHAFRICGLYPWDAAATDYSKVIPETTCSGVTRHPESADKPNSYAAICSQQLDTYLDAEKIKEFEATGNDWLGGIENKSLFRYWRYLKDSKSREAEHNTNSGTPPIEDHELTEYETCPSAEDVEMPADVPGPVTPEHDMQAFTSPVIVPGYSHLPAHVTPAEERTQNVGDFSDPPTHPSQAVTSPDNIVVGSHSVSAGPQLLKNKEPPKLKAFPQNAKKELLIRKEERIAERNQKKMEKEKQRTTKTQKAFPQNDTSSEDDPPLLNSSDNFWEGNELQVMGMRSVDKSKKIFTPKDDDVLYINISQVEHILPAPQMVPHGARMRYVFNARVDVYEM
ncbi:hypothetical protein PR048_015625 [Dryococelus australis]|uniref:Uncharacterized protein n=1 Tax=Dryococelus australis TaxID=614101 RepID=A0ABQ9HHF8_9NEOP|nr:hypothetical protein PR048_015625 [Dryococelus australis]